MNYVARPHGDAANLDRFIQLPETQGAVMYGHATGVRAEWDVRQPVDISHAAVGHQTHASGRKQGLAHSVTEHAFVIGPGPNCLDDPDDGLLDLTDLFQ